MALSIPLTTEEWRRDLALGSAREYARDYLRNGGGTSAASEIVWRELYEPREARPILETLSELRSFGVTVVTECTLGTLSELTRKAKVVVVVAHWRSGHLEVGHVIERRRFLDQVLSSSGVVLTHICRALRSSDADAASAPNVVDDEVRFAKLVAEIDRCLGTFRTEADAMEAPSPSAFYYDRNRALLNQECGAVLDATRGLELADGTHSAERVAAVVPHSFDGVFDLSVCYSVVLAEQLKRRAPGCLILANRDRTEPAFRLPIIRETLRQLHRSPNSYVDVTLDLRERLSLMQ